MTNRNLVWFALAAVLLVGIWLRAIHINDPHRLTPNERAYLYYAGRIYDDGLGANRSLFAEYVNNPDTWEVAPPVRIGYVMALEAAMVATGSKSVEAGMALSFGCSLLTLLAIAWMGVRFFNPWVAVIASALASTSFVEIWLVRGTPQDGLFGLLGLVTIWIVCEIMRSPNKLWIYALFHAVGIWAVLVKQSGVFIYGFGAMWLIGFLLFHERNLRRAIVLALSSAVGVALACFVLVLLAGDAHSAWRVYQLGFLCNDEAWQYQEECCFGPWTQVPLALFSLSPLTFVASVAGIFWAMLSSERGSALTLPERNVCGLCALMAVGFTFLFSFFPKMQILRYVSPGDGAVCLLGGVAIWCTWSFARKYLTRVESGLMSGLLAAGLIFGMYRDYRMFDKVAMQAALPELGAELIRSAAGPND